MIILLRFDGVYSYARLWVNGKYIREHRGGFTRWDSDITHAVLPGETASIVLEVTDEKDQISYASGYAKHPIGGILRDVWLLALPQDYVKHLFVETDFDDDYRDATIKLDIAAILQNEVTLRLRMSDPQGAIVSLENDKIVLSPAVPTALHSIRMPCPLKWDAEHPYLYTLFAELLVDGRMTYSQTQRIGFRKTIVDGNRFLVNGKPVKFRGACRHDMHPLLGRSASAQYDLLDVKLAKEANLNFIRTSYYPPPERFLEYADQYGLYVESESAVCFVDTFRLEQFGRGATQNDPRFTERYLSQLKEIVNTHRNHPSVVMWSLGNESTFGQNFKRSYDWVKASDRTRPVIFSFPGTVPDGVKCFDVLSMHYPDWNGSLSQRGKTTKNFSYGAMPVIFDEWAHIPCYDTATLMVDPNMRDFWGQSLDRMWEGVFKAQGGLGGAIWGMIDETLCFLHLYPPVAKDGDPMIGPSRRYRPAAPT